MWALLLGGLPRSASDRALLAAQVESHERQELREIRRLAQDDAEAERRNLVVAKPPPIAEFQSLLREAARRRVVSHPGSAPGATG